MKPVGERAMTAGVFSRASDRNISDAPKTSAKSFSVTAPSDRLCGSSSAHERLGLEFGGRGAAVGAVFKQIARLTIEDVANLAKRIEADPADLTRLGVATRSAP